MWNNVDGTCLRVKCTSAFLPVGVCLGNHQRRAVVLCHFLWALRIIHQKQAYPLQLIPGKRKLHMYPYGYSASWIAAQSNTLVTQDCGSQLIFENTEVCDIMTNLTSNWLWEGINFNRTQEKLSGGRKHHVAGGSDWVSANTCEKPQH